MLVPGWHSWISSLAPGRNTQSPQRRRAQSARLGIERLEERRVLNGGAVVVVALTATNGQNQEQVQPVVIETGTADGSADVFEVVRGEAEGKDLLQIEVNGSVVYSAEFDQVQSISFEGSSDQETLIIDFSHGGPIPLGGISFVGQSGTAALDSLVLANGDVDAANYAFSSSTDGQVQIGASGATTTITFGGSVGTVADTLNATSRTFDLGGTVTNASLQGAADGSAATQVALASGVGVTFANPTSSLTLHDETVGVLNLNLAGVGSGYDASLTIAGQSDANVYVSGVVQVGAHDVAVTGGTITVDGSVVSLGGTIEVAASERLFVSPTGVVGSTGGLIDISAPQLQIDGAVLAQNGGTIHLDAGPTGTLVVTGRLDASNDAIAGAGGTIDVLGQRVGLDGSATIDASGLAGGGLVRIGGDYQGANPLIHNAERVYVGAGVTISANAIDSGSGGRVIVWSDELTAFYGSVSARGGAAAGDGGFVEISGAESLVAKGNYDLGSPHGASGTLLFDPRDIIIVGGTVDGSDDTDLSATNLINNAGSNILGSILFSDIGTGIPVFFLVYESELENTDANIVLQAGRSITTSGTFTNDDVLISNNRSLTLQTRNDNSDGSGPINLTGSTTGANLQFITQGTGTITIEASTSGLQAGNVVLSALTTANTSIAVSTGNGSITFNGAVQTGTLTVNATDGVVVDSAVAANGATSVNADTNSDGVGTFSVGAAGSVATTDNLLTITAADIDLVGTLDSGLAQTSLLVTAGRTAGVGAAVQDYTLDGTELSHISAAGLLIGGATAGDMTVNGVTALQSQNAGPVTLVAGSNGASLFFNGSASTFQALSASADDGIAVDVTLATVAGDLALDGDADNAADTQDNIAFAAGVQLASAGSLTLSAATGDMTGAGALTLLAATGVTLNDSLTTAGITTINADSDSAGAGTFTFAGGAALATTGNLLSITSADIALAGTLNSGAAQTSLLVTAAHTVGIGAATGEYTLDGAELSQITAASLLIGGATARDMTVNGVTALQSQNAGPVALVAGSNGASLTFNDSASTFQALSASADDGIVVDVNLTTVAGDLALDGDLDDAVDTQDSIAFASGVQLTSAASLVLSAQTGDMTGAGSLTLFAATGVTLNDSLTTNGLTTIDADNDVTGAGTFTLAGGAALTTTANPLSITSADVNLAGTLNSGVAQTSLLVTAGHTVGIGAAIGEYTLEGTELSQITAASLLIGGATAGDMTVNGVTALQSQNAGLMSLVAGSNGASLTFNGSASTFQALSASADDGIAVDVNLTTVAGDLALDGDLDGAADTLDDIAFAAGVQLASAGSLTLSAATGDMTGAGALTLLAATGVTLNDSLTTNGVTAIDADSDSAGAGTFTLAGGAALATTDNLLSITSADIALAGTLNSGAAQTSLLVTAGHTVGIGAAAADYTLDSAELSQIAAASLLIGGAMAGDMTVNGVTALQSQNVGPVALVAGSDGASLTFNGNPSTFQALSGSADDGIVVDVNLTTVAGDLALDGDLDGAADTLDDIAFAAGVQLASAGSLTLSADTGEMTGAGSLTLLAATGVTLNDGLTTQGVTTINADSDAAGAGTFTLASGAALSTTGNLLSITAADIALAGTLNSGPAQTGLLVTAAHTVGIGAAVQHYTLDGTELSHITSASLFIGGATASDMTVNGVTALQSQNAGPITLVAGSDGALLTFNGSASTFQALSGSANDGIVVDVNLTTLAGDMSLDGDSDNAADTLDSIAFAAGVQLTSAASLTLSAETSDMAAAGSLILLAATGVTLNDSLTTSGVTTIDADSDATGAGTFTLAGGMALATTGNLLSITSADIDLAGTLDSGIAQTSLLVTADHTVGIGAAVGDYTLDGTELSQIAAASLLVGGPEAGTITVNGVTLSQNQNIDLAIFAAGSTAAQLLFTGAASDFNALTGTADGDIVVDAALTMHVGNLLLQSGQEITVNQNLTTLNGTGGHLFVTGGVTLNADVILGAGNVSLIAGGLDIVINTSHVQATTAQFEAPRDIIVKSLVETTAPGTDVILIADTDHDGSGGVWIQTSGQIVSADDVFIEGSNLFATGGLGGPLDSIRVDADGAADQIRASGDITLQNSAFTPAGSDVILDGVVRALGTGAIDVFAEHAIRTTSLLVAVDGAITLHSPVVLASDSQVQTAGGNIVYTVSATIDSDTGENNNLTISSAMGDVLFGATVGGIQPLGMLTVSSAHSIVAVAINAQQLSLTATHHVTLNDDVTTTGPATILADSEGDGSGTVTVAAGATVSTTGNPLQITTADLVLAGTLNSGTAITLVQTSQTGRGIDLGTETAGQLSLTDAELDRVTASVLQVGRRDTIPSGQITISAAISPANTTLLHLITNGGIVETAGSVTIANLALESTGAVVMDAGNHVQVLAAQVFGPGNSFSFANGAALALGTVDGIVGLITNGGDATLNVAGDGTQQALADIHVAALELVGTGSFLLINAGNEVQTLAASSTGAFSFRDANDLVVGVAGGTVGITTAGSPIAIETGGLMTLAQPITAAGSVVSLQSTGGAIADGNGAATNVASASLALEAVSGIGGSDAIETAVATLAAVNNGSGNIQIVNDIVGLLTIGAVGSLDGIQNSGPGFIALTNNGPLTVASLVQNTGGGDLTLTSLGDGTPGNDLTINAPVYALGGDGNIHLNAGTDLLINDTGFPIDVMTQNDGEIFGLAQGQVVIVPNVIVATGIGSISTIFPALDNVDSPQIESSGLAHVFGTFGDPGATNFTITVNWSDGTIDTYHFTNPGSFDFTHVYTSNPNPSNQAAPIPVTVTVFDDPHSHFVGLQQPPVTIPIGATDTKTIANGLDSITTFTNAPGEGLGFIRIDTTLKIPSLLFPPLPTLVYQPESVPPASTQSESGNSVIAKVDATNLQSRQVFLIAMNAAGEEIGRALLDENELDDLTALFRRLPDGRYQLWLKDPGERAARLLIDVNLRGGKPADDAEGGQDKPPGEETAPAQNPAAGAPKAAQRPANRADETANETTAAASTISSGDSTQSADDSLFGLTAVGQNAADTPIAEHSDQGSLATAVLGGAAATIVLGRHDWHERVDNALASGEARLSKAARLARRMRRILKQDGSSRAS